MNTDMEQAYKVFISEGHELLHAMEETLLNFHESEDPIEAMNSVFRVAHTIKGSAANFGLQAIVSFSHNVESVLSQVRDGYIDIDDKLINLMLQCKDHIVNLIASINDGVVLYGREQQEWENELIKQLETYLNPPHASIGSTLSNQTTVLHQSRPQSELMENDNWHISIQFGENVLRDGMDPLSFLRHLSSLGEIVHIITLFDAMPDAEHMDPESCYLAYEINFKSDIDKTTIEAAFDFIKDESQMRIIPPNGRAADFIEIIDTLSNKQLKLGEILVACGTLTPNELEQLLQRQHVDSNHDQPHRKLGEMIVEQKLASPQVVQAALEKQNQGQRSQTLQSTSIRVDASKIDQLINLIGSLVITGAGIEAGARETDNGHLQEMSTTMSRIIEEVRDSVLNLRMVQIGDTFNRFRRVVHDASQELGKSIELSILGAETELDKSIVEKISDPLMHLIRNSIDHGIEHPDARRQLNKAAAGLITLNAYHDSGTIVIEVSDDGCGLNRERILAKAIEKNLISADDVLSDPEVYRLIFEPGFSTAASLSNISGRGVSMDVVRRNIEGLRGDIEIDSQIHVGTTIRIRLPLTLAIIDGFMMGVGDSAYIVPLDIVEECIELPPEEEMGVQGRDVMNLRGEVLPFIRLRDHFHESGAMGQRENIVVVKYGNQKAGFVVDRLMGEYQTVIKPLGPLFQRIKGISGSTILGSGEVALILDAPSLIQLGTNKVSMTNHSTADLAIH